LFLFGAHKQEQSGFSASHVSGAYVILGKDKVGKISKNRTV